MTTFICGIYKTKQKQTPGYKKLLVARRRRNWGGETGEDD